MANNDRDNGDETNIEAIAVGNAAQYPLDDPKACRAIYKLEWRHVQIGLDHRVGRHRKEERERIDGRNKKARRRS
jgi:hypothetical protein